MNGKKICPGFAKPLRLVILVLFLVLLQSIIPCCKSQIETLPVHQDDVPIRMLDNGNYEVTKGYVLRHVALMAKVKILEAELEECRDK